ncbi:MAG TPA: TIGR02147 family protein [Deltaproteobacteria bacterium]|nr:TIGR02147 family protein [Deltaproteobacteria bacterium]
MPDLFQYLSYRTYLDDWFRWKKSQNPRFSHRLFARRAGLSSPSLLSNVISGRRNLTPRSAEAFCHAMSLSAEASEFFQDLVRLDRARTPAERNRIWERISATRRFRDARRIEGDGFRYLSSWHYAALRELTSIEGFREDPAWIARTLRPRITVPQAREALATLWSLGLLSRDEDGEVRPTEATVATASEVQGLAVHNFHMSMLELARSAITDFKPEERFIAGVTVSVPGSRIDQLKAELRGFMERVMDLCDEGKGERVYQVNVQLFPLTETLSGGG